MNARQFFEQAAMAEYVDHHLDTAARASIAISLRRIADALDRLSAAGTPLMGEWLTDPLDSGTDLSVSSGITDHWPDAPLPDDDQIGTTEIGGTP